MESKGPKNSEQIILDDSDCEIQELDINSITIPDSPESTINHDKSKLLETTNQFSEDNLLFEVNFKNEEVFNEYKDLILAGLTETLKDKDGFLLVEDETTIQVFRESPGAGEDKAIEICDTALKPDSAVETEDSTHLREEVDANIEATKPEEEVKASSDDDDMDIAGLFMIDNQPAKKVDVIQIPSYKRTIKEILNECSSHKKKKNEDECERPKQKKSCFNCEGIDHDLRTCPKPRNNSKINKAKKMMNYKRDRYHVDVEQRFAYLRPGQVSRNLREALCIRNGELPFFFYRMRVLGYPPGWLEDAKVAHSGISLFDSEGRSVRDPEDEEGEVEADKNKYDVNKIISFPGFNVDPGKNFYDDYKHHNVPPMSRANFKERFIEMLGASVIKGYKRKKLKIVPDDNESTEKSAVELSEMEIEDEENASVVNVEFTRPPPPSSPPPSGDAPSPPPPPPPPPPESPQNLSKRSPSPTLEDLEERQKRLLQELQSSIISLSDNEDSLIDEVLALETEISTAKNRTSTPIKSPMKIVLLDESEKPESPLVNGDIATETETPATPQTPLANAMESVLGTPLLKFSPFDKLPCGDNFKVGVSDVINFENLPDSTGTYEKMKGVIKKVRTIVTKLNSEDS